MRHALPNKNHSFINYFIMRKQLGCYQLQIFLFRNLSNVRKNKKKFSHAEPTDEERRNVIVE